MLVAYVSGHGYGHLTRLGEVLRAVRARAPRLMLPLSLSYDHRVIDGALAARFTSQLVKLLADMRRAML